MTAKKTNSKTIKTKPTPTNTEIFLWLEDSAEFVQYDWEKGIYASVAKERVVGYIRAQLDEETITTKVANDALLNFKIDHVAKNAELIDGHYIALKDNVIWDTVKNTPLDSDPGLKTRFYVPRHYNYKVNSTPVLWAKLLEAFEFGKSTLKDESGHVLGVKTHPIENQPFSDGQIWKQWVINTIHFWDKDRILPMLIGYPDAGKSPNIRILEYMLGSELVSDVRINKLGLAGELKEAMYAPIWVQEESSMGYVDDETIVVIKKNYSDNSTISVRNLYKDRQSVKGNRFIVGASNQCFHMSDRYNELGTFKRLTPLLCPNRFQKDVILEKQIKEPAFLDDLFSYLLNQPTQPCIGEYAQADFQRRNMELWNWSAYPIYRICEEIFERSYEFGSTLTEEEVDKLVMEQLIAQAAEIPKKLPKVIRETLEEMGASWKRRKEGDIFVGIKIRNSEINPFKSTKIHTKSTLDAHV